MIDIKKAEASQPEVNPTPQDLVPTESDAASSCAVKIRQHNKTEGNFGDVVHEDVEAAASAFRRLNKSTMKFVAP
jgi:hypothetical protein